MAGDGPAYRTISDVATLIGVPQHVLRFWETKFPQIAPLKRGGNRRYYRPEDIAALTTINRLLYTEGYTIKGVQKLLDGGLPAAPAAASTPRIKAKAAPLAIAGALPGVASAGAAPAALLAIRSTLAAALDAARAV